REARLQRHAPPARSRHRLFRCRVARDRRGKEFNHGDARIHGKHAVQHCGSIRRASMSIISATRDGNCISLTAGDVSSLDGMTPSEELRDALRSVEDSIEELNAALRQAVEAGATIALRR